jgi:hypothetical protein
MPGRPKNAPKLAFGDFASAQRTEEEVKQAAKKLNRAYQREREDCARDFWYFAQFLETYDEENESWRPFPTYDYLHAVHKDVETNQKNIFLKGRRLVMSWYFCARALWKAKFAGSMVPGSADVWQGGIFSAGEDKAEELMRRPQTMHDRLPDFLRCWNPMSVSNQLLKEFRHGGRIKGFPSQKEGPRSYGFSEAFFDEMAFQEFVRGVWKGLVPTLGAKGKLNAVSTPNGKFNLFADIWHNKNKRYSDVNRVKLEWWLHPEHDDNWREALASGLTEAEIAQELDLSFAIPQGDPVFPETQRKIHVVGAEDIEFIHKRPTYIGFDLGYHFPAMTIWQRNSRDQWMGHIEHLMYDCDFEEFCTEGLEVINTLYDRTKTPEMFCLPSDAKLPYRTKSASGAQNDLQVIRDIFGLRPHQTRFGPQEVGTRANEGPRIKEMRAALKLRKDGEPGMFWSENMEHYTDAMLGGYCYPESTKQGKFTEQPAENEYTHVVDSAQATITVYNRMVNPDVMIPEKHVAPGRPTLLHDRVPRNNARTAINLRRRRR